MFKWGIKQFWFYREFQKRKTSVIMHSNPTWWLAAWIKLSSHWNGGKIAGKGRISFFLFYRFVKVLFRIIHFNKSSYLVFWLTSLFADMHIEDIVQYLLKAEHETFVMFCFYPLLRCVTKNFYQGITCKLWCTSPDYKPNIIRCLFGDNSEHRTE